MQRELARVLACVCACVCECSLSPLSLPSLPKVRESVEHGRRQGGELVVVQVDLPAGDPREKEWEHARQKERGRDMQRGEGRV
jgi:hypothetical protein